MTRTISVCEIAVDIELGVIMGAEMHGNEHDTGSIELDIMLTAATAHIPAHDAALLDAGGPQRRLPIDSLRFGWLINLRSLDRRVQDGLEDRCGLSDEFFEVIRTFRSIVPDATMLRLDRDAAPLHGVAIFDW